MAQNGDAKHPLSKELAKVTDGLSDLPKSDLAIIAADLAKLGLDDEKLERLAKLAKKAKMAAASSGPDVVAYHY